MFNESDQVAGLQMTMGASANGLQANVCSCDFCIRCVVNEGYLSFDKVREHGLCCVSLLTLGTVMLGQWGHLPEISTTGSGWMTPR